VQKIESWMILFLVALFAFATVDKLLHVPGFIKAIDNYRMLPMPMGWLLAPVVIAAEAVVAIGLLRREWRRSAALAGAILMAVFTVGLLGNRLSGEDAICGCWFSISMAQGDSHFVLNASIIGMSLFVWNEAADVRPLATARA
jgi:uncharacterized membrane protein YphA (DoxX/SURF4 family)